MNGDGRGARIANRGLTRLQKVPIYKNLPKSIAHKTIIRLEAEGRPACAGLFLFKAYVGFVCCYLSDGFMASLAEGAGLLLALALLWLGELLLQVFHLLA